MHRFVLMMLIILLQGQQAAQTDHSCAARTRNKEDGRKDTSIERTNGQRKGGKRVSMNKWECEI